MRSIFFIIIAASVIIPISAPNQENTTANSVGPPYQLDHVEFMSLFKGSHDARRLLAQNGFVVTGDTRKQIFSYYVKSGPYLITTDSAWAGLMALLENALIQVEISQVTKMENFCRSLLEETRKVPKSLRHELSVYAASGLCLIRENKLSQIPRPLRDDVARNIKLVQEDRGGKVSGFSIKLPPGVFHPQGFYRLYPMLSKLWQARRWFDYLIFRSSVKEEALRGLWLAKLLTRKKLGSFYHDLNGPWTRLFENGDKCRISRDTVQRWANIADEFKVNLEPYEGIARQWRDIRKKLLAISAPEVVDFATRQVFNNPEKLRGLRLMESYTTPETLFWAKYHRANKFQLWNPSGLDLVGFGPLASLAGRQAWNLQGFPLKSPVNMNKIRLPDSFYGRALACLRLLQDPVHPKAPSLFHQHPWRLRMVGTQLAGWAGLRRVFACHAKKDAVFVATYSIPLGRVSPYPEFYRHLGDLAREVKTWLQDLPSSRDRDTVPLASFLIQHFGHLGPDNLEMELVPAKWRKKALTLWNKKDHLAPYNWQQEVLRQIDDHPYKVYKALGLARKVLSGYATGKRPAIDLWQAIGMGRFFPQVGPNLLQFSQLCYQLASLSKKQLVCEGLNLEEKRLIQGYGRMLANTCFLYLGNSYLAPRDDAPGIAPVSHYRDEEKGLTFYTATARPETLYIILPVQGRPILHIGGVLSYRELIQDTGSALNDETWRRRVRTGKIPPVPQFMTNYRVGVK